MRACGLERCSRPGLSGRSRSLPCNRPPRCKRRFRTVGTRTLTLQQLRHMLHEGWGGQQRGSSSNLTRPRETPRVTRTTSVEWPAMQGFVGADLLGFLDGMQGVRGSNPLSSTTTTPQVSGTAWPSPHHPLLDRAQASPGVPHAPHARSRDAATNRMRPREPPRVSPPALVQCPATQGFVVGAVVGIPRWHARGQGFKSPQLHQAQRISHTRSERCLVPVDVFGFGSG